MRLERKRWVPLVATVLILLYLSVMSNVPAEGMNVMDNSNTYLPMILLMPTSTPTVTPTPTLTPTITNTPTIPIGPSSPPLPSISYYLKTMDPNVSYQLGCKLGERDLARGGTQRSLVVLHYAHPQQKDGAFGASTYSTEIFVPLNVIFESARSFGYGYWYCVGWDFESHLTLAVGTSNYKSRYFPSVTYEHGEAWSKMVNDLDDWFKKTCSRGCDGQVDVMGASDIELSWNYPADSINWVNGFASVAGHRNLVNFGALPGCPYLSKPGAQCGSWPYIWSKDQVLKVTSENWIDALPEIYLNSGINAEQWYLMSVYSYTKLGRPMRMAGTLTQYQACLQRSSDPSCEYMDNTPAEGWTQLYNLVEKDARTAVGLFYSSDIKWQGEKEVPVPYSANQIMKGANWPKPQILSLPTPVVRQPAPADFIPEIVDGSDGWVRTWEADIRNLWYGTYQGQYARVLAGAHPEDAQQGLVIVMLDDPLTGDFVMRTVLAPADSGALRVTGSQGGQIALASEGGSRLTFDLATLSFVP